MLWYVEDDFYFVFLSLCVFSVLTSPGLYWCIVYARFRMEQQFYGAYCTWSKTSLVAYNIPTCIDVELSLHLKNPSLNDNKANLFVLL